jgi:hypothetical protein
MGTSDASATVARHLRPEPFSLKGVSWKGESWTAVSAPTVPGHPTPARREPSLRPTTATTVGRGRRAGRPRVREATRAPVEPEPRPATAPMRRSPGRTGRARRAERGVGFGGASRLVVVGLLRREHIGLEDRGGVGRGVGRGADRGVAVGARRPVRRPASRMVSSTTGSGRSVDVDRVQLGRGPGGSMSLPRRARSASIAEREAVAVTRRVAVERVGVGAQLLRAATSSTISASSRRRSPSAMRRAVVSASLTSACAFASDSSSSSRAGLRLVDGLVGRAEQAACAATCRRRRGWTAAAPAPATGAPAERGRLEASCRRCASPSMVTAALEEIVDLVAVVAAPRILDLATAEFLRSDVHGSHGSEGPPTIEHLDGSLSRAGIPGSRRSLTASTSLRLVPCGGVTETKRSRGRRPGRRSGRPDVGAKRSGRRPGRRSGVDQN